MAEKKRFYWIKLKENFFDLETIDWLISQKNGCEYIVLYQKLCLLTANKGGELSMKIGEMIIPYDINKIARDTKFSVDTVIVAVELFKKIGLIYEQEDGVLKIPYVEEMVGSETSSAKRVREYRQRQALQCNTECNGDVTQEKDNRVKRIENRDKIKEEEKKDNTYRQVITHLNDKAGTSYKATSQATQRHINARIADGYTIEDFYTVIDKKCAEWKGTDMEKYLRPETLFGSKFEGYLNQKAAVQKKNDGWNMNQEEDSLDDLF